MTDPIACASCGAPFAPGSSLEDAETEYAREYPEQAAAGIPMELVCTPCYERGTGDAGHATGDAAA